MNTANRPRLLRALITLGVALALAVVVTTPSTPVHADSHPDLDVETPSVADTDFIPVADGSFYPGDRFTLRGTVTNVGGGDAESTPLRYYRSADSTITSSDTEQGVTGVSALAAGGTRDYYVFLTAPSEAGTYYYGACVDSVTGESNITNNCSSVMVTVLESEPDLVLASPGASDRIEMGGVSG